MTSPEAEWARANAALNASWAALERALLESGDLERRDRLLRRRDAARVAAVEQMTAVPGQIDLFADADTP